jgi:hypothetical protein
MAVMTRMLLLIKQQQIADVGIHQPPGGAHNLLVQAVASSAPAPHPR